MKYWEEIRLYLGVAFLVVTFPLEVFSLMVARIVMSALDVRTECWRDDGIEESIILLSMAIVLVMHYFVLLLFGWVGHGICMILALLSILASQVQDELYEKNSNKSSKKSAPKKD